MKKQGIVIVVALTLVAALSLVGCKSKQERSIDKLDRLVEHMEKHGDNFSEEEWKQTSEQYEDIMEDLYDEEENLSPEQNREVGRLTARYHKALVKSYSNKLKDFFENGAEQLGGYMEELLGDDWTGETEGLDLSE